MELESRALAAGKETGYYTARIEETGDGPLIVYAADVIRELIGDVRAGTSPDRCAATSSVEAGRG